MASGRHRNSNTPSVSSTGLLLILYSEFVFFSGEYLRLAVRSPEEESSGIARARFVIVQMPYLCGRVVRMLDLQSSGLGFEPWPPHCRVQSWASCASVIKQYNLMPANGSLASGKVT